MIQITYRFTTRLSMRVVKNGDVHISAPIGFPRSKIDAFIEQNQSWIAKAQERSRERYERRASFFDQLPLDSPEQREQAANRLSTLIQPMLTRYAREMNLPEPAVTYKPMISRWGMCNVRERSICFSTYLLLLPDWCVEHVVVHELCHLLEPSHNARFHALMDRFFPRWREANATTRRIYRMQLQE